MIYYLFDKIFFQWAQNLQDPAGSVINWPPRTGSGSVSQDYGSADPDPSEIFMDPQHCFNESRISKQLITILSNIASVFPFLARLAEPVPTSPLGPNRHIIV